MIRILKIGVLLALLPTLAWGFQHATPIDLDATEAESPFDGHYERTSPASKTTLDILQVGPGILRIQGVAGSSQISGTTKPDRLKAHFENTAGCKLDILFHAEGLKVQNTSKACGSLFDGEYTRTGPPVIGRNPGVR